MEKIKKAVEKLHIEELREIAQRYYNSLVTDVTDVISGINRAVDRGGIDFASMGISCYNSLKLELDAKGLWDKRYDEGYEEAIKGELDLEKLLGVKV